MRPTTAIQPSTSTLNATAPNPTLNPGNARRLHLLAITVLMLVQILLLVLPRPATSIHHIAIPAILIPRGLPHPTPPIVQNPQSSSQTASIQRANDSPIGAETRPLKTWETTSGILDVLSPRPCSHPDTNSLDLTSLALEELALLDWNKMEWWYSIPYPLNFHLWMDTGLWPAYAYVFDLFNFWVVLCFFWPCFLFLWIQIYAGCYDHDLKFLNFLLLTSFFFSFADIEIMMLCTCLMMMIYDCILLQIGQLFFLYTCLHLT